MKIIIVDDHVLFREGLAAIIGPEPGIEISGLAGSVAEAVEIARTVKPDIILMDFNLPDGTGVDATRLILSEQPKCKIIFLTVSEDDNSLFDAVRSGAKGYLSKSMRPAKLVAAIHSVQQGESALSPSMTMRVMEELSRTKKSDPPADTNLTKLTQREVEVLQALSSGLSNREIANLLFLSENTVKYHVHSILDKLNFTDRKEAANYAREHGLAK
jgi:DNA-binding NarL/FixJ family response regulator